MKESPAKQSYQGYLKSEEWRVRRELIKSRDHYRCRLCHSTESLQVHHATYENRGAEKDNDLITLCGKCHTKFHGIEIGRNTPNLRLGKRQRPIFEALRQACYKCLNTSQIQDGVKFRRVRPFLDRLCERGIVKKANIVIMTGFRPFYPLVDGRVCFLGGDSPSRISNIGFTGAEVERIGAMASKYPRTGHFWLLSS